MPVRLGYDQALLAKVAEALARAVMHDMRWDVLERHSLTSVEPLHEDDDLDMDLALAACLQLGLAGPHAIPPPESRHLHMVDARTRPTTSA